MSPEALQDRKFTHASDVWWVIDASHDCSCDALIRAFAVCIWEVTAMGATPYHNLPPHNVVSLILDGHCLPRVCMIEDHDESHPYQEEICSEALYTILCSCWHTNPKRRPTFNSLSTQLSGSSASVVRPLKTAVHEESLGMNLNPAFVSKTCKSKE